MSITDALSNKIKALEKELEELRAILASPLPAPLSPAELAEASRLLRDWGRLVDTLTPEAREVVDVANRLLVHAASLADDCRRMATDNGYLEGVDVGRKQERAKLLPALYIAEKTLRTSGPGPVRCPCCECNWKDPHAPDCALDYALTKSN